MTFPRGVMGTLSPYPTVVTVTMLHHAASPNPFIIGFSLASKKYIQYVETRRIVATMTAMYCSSFFTNRFKYSLLNRLIRENTLTSLKSLKILNVLDTLSTVKGIIPGISSQCVLKYPFLSSSFHILTVNSAMNTMQIMKSSL